MPLNLEVLFNLEFNIYLGQIVIQELSFKTQSEIGPRAGPRRHRRPAMRLAEEITRMKIEMSRNFVGSRKIGASSGRKPPR